MRYTRNVFDNNYKATIGVDFEVEKYSIMDIPFTLQMWDTAGSERFQCIASSYYRNMGLIDIKFVEGVFWYFLNFFKTTEPISKMMVLGLQF